MRLYTTIYTFEDVKKLFDGYNIKKDGNGKFLVVKRGTNITYDNPDLADKVKFAHTWLAATEFGRSRTASDSQVVTPEDYSYAFNEDAKVTYDFIMDIASQTLMNDGNLIGREQLKSIVEQAALRSRSTDIVDGLYSNKRFLESFDKWVRACNNLPTNQGALTSEVKREASSVHNNLH